MTRHDLFSWLLGPCLSRGTFFLAASLLCIPQWAAASTEAPDPATATRQATAYILENETIGLRFETRSGRLARLDVQDRQHARRLSMPVAFTLTMGDGVELRAAQMVMRTSPEIGDLKPNPEASRYAERLPGKQICADLAEDVHSVRVRWCAVLRDGSSYLRQEVTIEAADKPLAIASVRLLEVADRGAHVSGVVMGSPAIDSTMFFGFEHPFSVSEVKDGVIRASLARVLPVPASQSVTYSSVIGVAPAGQMRRAFLGYIERERAHPYRTFLHYNSWYDLGAGENYDEAGAVSRVQAFGEELVQKRGATFDSFMMDDGWDDPSTLWRFHKGFPAGFERVRQAAAKYGLDIGVWLSPWGGYDEAKKQRIAFGAKAGYEIVKGGYALSGPRYYPEFEQVCVEMIRKYGVNQFKLDGTGNASQVVPGSAFDSDFNAAIHLIDRLRQEKPGIYINLTTGTYPSPFWLRYADSVWRGGEDHSFAGVGSWRQQWITYRDAQTYKNIVQAAPLFPLNSLMLHGIVYAQLAEHLGSDPDHDFGEEVRSYFGSGTQLQELYVTPSLLSPEDWDALAASAKWSRANAAILGDTHWIGGDPGKLEAYGWAAWAPGGWIVTLRNPSDRAQEFQLNLRRALEIPAQGPASYQVEQPFAASQTGQILWPADGAVSIALKPFEVRTFEWHDPSARP